MPQHDDRAEFNSTITYMLYAVHKIGHSYSPCYVSSCFYMNVSSHSVSLSVPAGVDVTFAYGASEEAFAAITARSSIVFPCGLVSTDRTVAADPIWTR